MDKRCSRCGEMYDAEAFFRKASSQQLRPYASSRTHYVCVGCEMSARTTVSRRNRWLQKANDALRSHARKLGTSIETLRDLGWDPARMAHEAEHAYGNGCPECGDRFGDMGHGLADVTLDIIDPKSPAVYGMNTRWICMTCNRAKGKTAMALRARKRMAWAKWQRRQEELARDPWKGTLFEGTDF